MGSTCEEMTPHYEETEVALCHKVGIMRGGVGCVGW